MTVTNVSSVERPAPDAQAPEILRAVEIARSFGETRALQACTLGLESGEIHAVVGENGSGKSTLVKVLSGVIFPDSGSIRVDGDTLGRIRTPHIARSLGIATVFQEVLVVGPMSVVNNIWLGADGDFRTHVGWERKRTEAREWLGLLLEHPPSLDTPVELLDLSSRQVIVIVRALVQRPRVLILDEATSSLDVSTRDRLFDVLRRLRQQGTATIFISHRMDEILELADRATVLRGGVSVGTLSRAELEPHRMLELMSGGRVSTELVNRTAREQGEPELMLEDLVIRPGGAPLQTVLRSGEIVGVAGLEGHGQDAFLRALAGIAEPCRGRILRRREGEWVQVRSQRQAAELGIAYVPRDRKLHGVFEPLSILDNFSLPTLGRDVSPAGLISDRRRRRRLDEWVGRLGITLASSRDSIISLSGGNQQKVVIARWLATEPRVLVLDDPTRGVDVGTKRDLYRLLGELASRGIAVVMLSTEIEEHVALMDRVLVFREGDVSAEIPREQLSPDRLIAAFFGRDLAEGRAA